MATLNLPRRLRRRMLSNARHMKDVRILKKRGGFDVVLSLPGEGPAKEPKQQETPMNAVTSTEAVETVKQKTMLTLRQQMEVKAILDVVLMPTQEGKWWYRDNGSDADVPPLMTFPCTAANVRHVREQLFGPLEPPKPREETLEERIKVLEERLARIEKELGL